MSDISLPKGLRPKSKFFSAVGENMINVDGAIQLLLTTDTPVAKAMRRVFRRKLAECRAARSELTEEKQREEALFATFSAMGIAVNDMGKIDGSLDE